MVVVAVFFCCFFFARLREFWENVGPLIPHLRFILFIYLLKMKISSRTLFHSLGQDQSTVAQRAKTTVAEYSLTNYV